MAAPELARFVASPDATPEQAALILARDAYPNLDVGRYLGAIEALARSLRARLAIALDPFAQAREVGTFLFTELGYKGNDDDYYDVRNSYLNEVIDQRKGIPLTLAILILGVLRRCSVRAEGVGFPGHFLVRIGGPSGCFVDPFVGARVLSKLDLEILLKRALGPDAELQPMHVTVTDVRGMMVRMLQNLRAIFQKQGDHARGMLVCDRLVDLGAGLAAVRDRGMFAMQRGAFEAAREDLSAYLAGTPNPPDRQVVEKAIAKVLGKRATLN